VEKKKNYFTGWNFIINTLIAFIPASIVSAILRELVTGYLRVYYQKLLSEGGNPEEIASKIAIQGGLLNAVITIVVIFGLIYLVGLLRKKISERGNKKTE
jgi:uncharacterized membrane protein